MNELKSLEHPTLKIPYEVFNKRYRNAQKVLDIEARHVASCVSEIDNAVGKELKAGEIHNLLGGMVEKLITMKRKASDAISEELQMANVCKKRLDHLKDYAKLMDDTTSSQNKTLGVEASSLNQTNMEQWRKVRLDRLLVDYCLRFGYYQTANKLADATDLKELSNCEIYGAAAEVEAELAQRRTARSLQWCQDNKSKLKKLGSNCEFKIRIQEFVELIRQDKRLEAVRYARKHFSTYDEAQLPEIQQCMGMLAFPKESESSPYAATYQRARWAALRVQARREHARLLHPAPPPLPVALQLGLAALNTPQCGKPGSRVAACPACAAPLGRLARALGPAPCTRSRLACRVSRAPLDEHNQPMVLPNGQVYGEKALKEMMKEYGAIICPKTKEVFSIQRVEKVYVM